MTRFVAMMAAGALGAGLTSAAAAQVVTPAPAPGVMLAQADAPAGSGPRPWGLRAAPLPNARKEKAAYLGVATTPAAPSLREQLRLPRGVGLVVDLVEEAGPAAAAGLRQHDVLHKLDDQILVNVPQLSVLVRSRKPGDEVTLTLIRQGQPQTLAVKLAERELPVLEDLVMAAAPHVPDVLRLWSGGPPPEGAVSVRVDRGDCEVTWSDAQHTLRLRTRDVDGRKDGHLTVQDAAGRTVFEGPVNTEQQRQALPADVATKLHRLEKAGVAEGPVHFEAPVPATTRNAK